MALGVNHVGQLPCGHHLLQHRARLWHWVTPSRPSRHGAGGAAKEAGLLPLSVETSFQGAALAFQASLSNTLLLILAAVVTMYIVLGVLYESYHPPGDHPVHPAVSGAWGRCWRCW